MSEKLPHSNTSEYESLALSIRHYENLFFANLTVSVTVFGGLIGAVFLRSTPPSNEFRILVAVIGSLMSILLCANNYRFLDRWYKLTKQAKKFETDHKFEYEHFRIIRPCLRLGLIGWTFFYLFAFFIFIGIALVSLCGC